MTEGRGVQSTEPPYPECAEGGHVNDDNPTRPICRTCDDDPGVAVLYPVDVAEELLHIKVAATLASRALRDEHEGNLRQLVVNIHNRATALRNLIERW